jgi:ATP-dependent helicase HrpA
LLAGLLGNIGMKSETEASFTGARGIKFHAHPGSALVKKAGRWVMAAELVETTRLYARTLATIEPGWIEGVGGHLLKTLHTDPHWEKARGQVAAFERGVLYGLPVYTQRRVDYGAIDARHAREIFIRTALVEGELDTRAPFFVHNQRQMREIEELEHKSRRPDVLVDDDLIFAFYDALVPAEVCSLKSFDAWRNEAEKKDPKLLYLKRADLMRHEAAGITTEVFPKQLALGAGGTEFALSYHFEPGSPRDGVTATVPVAALNQIVDTRTEWLVPGMRREKVQALLKSLPQKIRRHCVPVPDFAARFCEKFGNEVRQTDAPLAQALAHFVREQTGVAVPIETFRADTLPAHLVMNFKIIDEHGRQLDLSRNLAELRAAHRASVQAGFERMAEKIAASGDGAGKGATGKGGAVAGGRILHANCTNWDFGDLEDIVEVHNLIGYPAVVDHQAFVNVELIDAQGEAEAAHRKGLMRLLQLQMKEQIVGLKKSLPVRQLGMQFLQFGSEADLTEQLVEAGLARACLADPLPRKQAEFMARRGDAKVKLGLITQEIASLVGRILDELSTLNKKLAGAKAYPTVVADIQAQVQRLLPKNFIVATPHAQLAHVPRYLKAAVVRLDKLRTDPARDTRQAADLAPLMQNYLRKQQEHFKARVSDARLEEFRWLLEELRVSLFAQELKTPMPVSVKRLQKAWDAYRNL